MLRRASQACQPCRRKKTRCPGERPRCSVCVRLDQPCTYSQHSGRIDRRAGISKETRYRPEHSFRNDSDTSLDHVSASRILRLEQEVARMSQRLSRKDTGSAAAGQRLPDTDDENVDETEIIRVDTDPITPPGLNSDHRSIGSRRVTPAQLAELYLCEIQGQPLLLFNPDTLKNQIHSWPEYLISVAFALTSRYSDSEEDVQHVMEIACGDIMTGMFRGSYDLDLHQDNDTAVHLLQGLCLLAFLEITNSFAIQASTHIGIVLRQSKELLKRFADVQNSTTEQLSRCLWSALVLDNTYMMDPQITARLSPSEHSKHAQHISPSIPNTDGVIDYQTGPQSGRRGIRSFVKEGQEPLPDFGICSYYGKLLGIWNSAMQLPEFVKDEQQPTDLWEPSSPYHAIVASNLAFEARMPDRHRLKGAGFESLDATEISRRFDYWVVWLGVQLLFHGVRLVIHHPLIHIAKRNGNRRKQPGSFQQHSVDQAFLHARWILRLHEMSRGKGLYSNNPFNYHLASIAATAFLFFVHSQDHTLNEVARENWTRCHEIVREGAQRWPHLRHTVAKLDDLSACISPANRQRSDATELSLLWQLLNYTESTCPQPNRRILKTDQTIDLRVKTQFLAPLEGVETGNPGMPAPTTAEQESSAMEPEVQAALNANVDPLVDLSGLVDVDYCSIFETGVSAPSMAVNGDLYFDISQL